MPLNKKFYSFDVYLNDVLIDTVFYSSDYLKGFKTLREAKESIKQSLINHDGYYSNIEMILKY